MAGIFRFKQFSVDQSGCAMKINTDGVLIGALTEVDQPKNLLDIGTGTGVIALMLAQRFPHAHVDAVEIDQQAANTALKNFETSPFADRLNVFSESFESFSQSNPDKKYDLIVSNPPFYINSLTSPQAGKNLAKHTDADFFEVLMAGVPNHLTAGGAFWLVLPIDTADLVKTLAQLNQLHLQKIIDIKSYPESKPHREILVFGLNESLLVKNEFVIYESLKQYSGEYQMVLQDFFTIFP